MIGTDARIAQQVEEKKKTSWKTSHLSVQLITTIDEIEFGPICFWQISFDFLFEWASACASWPRLGMFVCVFDMINRI